MVDSVVIWPTVPAEPCAHSYCSFPPSAAPLCLNVAWHPCGCPYQITPHSTSNVLRISSIIRQVFKHHTPPPHAHTHKYALSNSQTTGRADSRRHICFSTDGGVFWVYMTYMAAINSLLLFKWGEGMCVPETRGWNSRIATSRDAGGKSEEEFPISSTATASMTPISCLSIEALTTCSNPGIITKGLNMCRQTHTYQGEKKLHYIQ